MKLFYSSGACSLSPHIVAHEAGIELSLQKVDLKTKTIATEGDFFAINPKGYVPTLQLDDGEILTEGPVIAQYLADLQAGKGAGAAGRHDAALSPAGVARLHQLGAAQDLFAALPTRHSGGDFARSGRPISPSATPSSKSSLRAVPSCWVTNSRWPTPISSR